ncbi:hypothetical protein [Hymenobacter wooponensis]|uniref:STAS/SEC14 domain-containing protein n=1 Tax=Hymenobacter wooponensis TaxID=1525360 RepID=A0A4Z0MFL3_9BACT|nr:hypothetical protein [Hymenobacter wooponensis]TGD78269.1 hypothetical protein EU557_19350 [Hymenobacter wooponensis]
MSDSTSLSPPDSVELHYRNDLQILTARWLRPIPAPELVQSYEAALSKAKQHRARYWLLDVRGRGPASEDDTEWVLTEFFPRLHEQLGGRVYVCFLLAASQLSAAEQEEGAPLVANEQYHVRLFTAEAPALAWLSRRQDYESA